MKLHHYGLLQQIISNIFNACTKFGLCGCESSAYGLTIL